MHTYTVGRGRARSSVKLFYAGSDYLMNGDNRQYDSKMLRHFSRWYDPRGGRDQAGSAGRSAAFTHQSGRSQLHLRWPEPYPSQRNFLEMEGAIYKGLSGPVGTGKSKCLCYEGLKLALKNA